LGALLGWVVALAICQATPKVYASIATVSDPLADSFGRFPIPPAHAVIIAESLLLAERWDVTFEDAVNTVATNTYYERTIELLGVTQIVAHAATPSDARLIAESSAISYHGWDAEKTWITPLHEIRPFSEEEKATLEKLKTLRELLDQSRGSAPEAFHRQLGAFKELAQPKGRFCPPGDPLTTPSRILIRPVVSSSPVTPDVDLIMGQGPWYGAFVAAVFIICARIFLPRWLAYPRGEIHEPLAVWAEEPAGTAAHKPGEW
jgi:hypothetical protein